MEQRATFTTNEPLADARDMFAIHTAFRREFGLMPGLVRSVAPGDVSRTEQVADHIALMILVLHTHHTEEDRHVWPRLQSRGSAEINSLVRTMEDEHLAIFECYEEIEAARKLWLAAASAEARDAVAYAAERLLPVLKRHLHEEEERVVPLIEKYITAAEWAKIPQEAAGHIPPEKFPIILGMIAYEAAPDVIDNIVAQLPADLRLFIKPLASKAYASYAQALYGNATPPRATEATTS